FVAQRSGDPNCVGAAIGCEPIFAAGLPGADGKIELSSLNDGFGRAANRVFNPAVQINNAGQVIARDRESGTPPSYFIRTWPDGLVVDSSGGLLGYDSLISYATINSRSQVAYVGVSGADGFLVSPFSAPLDLGRFAGPRPLLADDGSIVVRK